MPRRAADRVVWRARHGRHEGWAPIPAQAKQIDLTTGEIGLHTTPTVVKDVVIVGSAFKEGSQPETHNNTKGIVRACDVRTGKLHLAVHTIPMKGEFGYDTWLNNSADVNGNTGVWTGITVDEDLGLVYLPVEDPTVDQYGGNGRGIISSETAWSASISTQAR